MVALWCVIGLIVAAIAVSTLGAGFSVFGLSQLFSGAAIAIIAMTSSLELAKFVIAAYLHQTWRRQNLLFKSYLCVAIVVLSGITSMGIFGFLSNAYQSASAALEAENVKIASLKGDLSRNEAESARLAKSVDDIPINRVSKRLQQRAIVEPQIAQLKAKAETINASITESDLRIIEVKKKVGPLIYIAKAFKVEIDEVVKYLILVFVFVFDPLAICLVIATSQALMFRRLKVQMVPMIIAQPAQPAQPSPVPAPVPQPQEGVVKMRFVSDEKSEAS